MSEDVSKFLMQVKELGDRRVEEDEARSRELEEKILQEKKERQARRAERARSISPQKSSPANTPPPPSHRTSTPATDRLALDSSPIIKPPASPTFQSSPPTEEEMPARVQPSTSPSKENESPFDTESKSAGQTSPTRTGSTVRGLSWQQRPNSQASDRSRSRPLSVVATENAARSSTTPSEPVSATEPVSKDQIASALSSKDPSWFRQTPDRGAGSAAYRRSQAPDSPTIPLSTPRTQLPGMSRVPSGEPPKDDSSSHPDTPAQHKKVLSLGSPLPLSSFPKLDPPSSDTPPETEMDQERPGLMSPPLGRTSPIRSDRPVSPTKGMGGFVESAMMKRSDSISKRWSVQSPTGLKRVDSIASNRTGHESPTRSHARSRSRPANIVHEAFRDPALSPTLGRDAEHQGEDGFGSARSSSIPKLETKLSPGPQESETRKTTPPVSPSKTMDSRRWSPTKASWLESALNKPESPKPKMTQAPPSQPAWMAEIQKAKAEKAANSSIERSRSPTISHKHQVSIGGLMRSSAPGTTAKPPPLSGLESPVAPTLPSLSPNLHGARRELQSPTSPVVEKGTPEKAKETKPAESSLPASNPKTETPPKKDFRANLKSRPAPGSNSVSGPDNELKNVFGNLRKTTTQNYVAPDELKGNILKGKAALNITGGPQKNERKDEFKEAILAKKTEFQKVQSEGRGISRKDSVSSETPVPEGLAKRGELGRSKSFYRDPVIPESMVVDNERTRSMSKPERAQEPQPPPRNPERERSRSRVEEKREPIPEPVTSRAGRRPTIAIGRDSVNPTPISKRFQEATSLPGPVKETPAPGSAHATPISKRFQEATSLPGPPKETAAPGRLPGKLAGSALANRFNPALAGLLAKGPPGASSTSTPAGISASKSTSEANDNEAGPAPKLTHMTKNRARGPKRKTPSTIAPAATTDPKESGESLASISLDEAPPSPTKKDEPPASIPEPKVAETAPADSSTKFDRPTRPKTHSISVAGAKKSFEAAQEETSTKPPGSPKKIHEQANAPPSPSKIHEQVAAFAAHSRRPSSPSKPFDEPKGNTSQPPSPRKLNMNRISRFLDESNQAAGKSSESEKPEAKKEIEAPAPLMKPKASFDKSPSPGLQKSLPSPPIDEPKRVLPDPITLGPKRQPSKDTVESGMTTPEARSTSSLSGRPLPSIPPTSSPESSTFDRPLPAEPKKAPRPLSTTGIKSRPTSPTMRSPTKQAMETSTILNDFFGPERPKRNYKVDAAELLMQRPNLTRKLETLSAQLFQVSVDRKKQPVPTHHERVLFEREMYLCPHTFKDEAGKKITEVYFWAGDGVPQPTVDDVTSFVTREAKSLGGKLVKLQQGKETAAFLQALGGIVVTQRGSGTKYDSLAPHMLCGRRHLGHIVFDEVDFTPSVLCSGFPFLVTQAGKCYLWKGKGSGVDELSCARLIGMDYALSGEMEEFEDGRESAAFWDLFDGTSTKPGSADHWRLKPNYDKYCSRLFCSDAASKKQQIIELSPFAQADLQPTGIYVLDAFFELYIVVGARAQSQYASFHNALEFAQEYGILAAGMEDRPFVPFSTVVLEGVPRDLKSVFRKWRDANSPTIMNNNVGGSPDSTGLKRGRSLRIVPLNQALLALNE